MYVCRNLWGDVRITTYNKTGTISRIERAWSFHSIHAVRSIENMHQGSSSRLLIQSSEDSVSASNISESPGASNYPSRRPSQYPKISSSNVSAKHNRIVAGYILVVLCISVVYVIFVLVQIRRKRQRDKVQSLSIHPSYPLNPMTQISVVV
jgi:hypothetical protein